MEFPSMTKTWHHKTYPAISPSNPSLSAAGKTVFITGALARIPLTIDTRGGTGIGVEITRSFAAAGASTIAISGRTEKTLVATKNTVEASFPNTKVLTFVADSTDEKAVNTAFQTVGHVDILVNNAAFMAELVPIAESEPSSWWKGYEINVLGGYVVTRAFLQVAAAEDAVLVNITSAAVHIAPTSGYSSYQPSKLASTKFFDIVAVENPGIRVINVHPGVIETLPGNMSLDAGAPFPIDEVSLPADFVVWAASPEAKFLQGKLVWSNWDVKELMARAKEIQEGSDMTLGLLGWPYLDYTSKMEGVVRKYGPAVTNGH